MGIEVIKLLAGSVLSIAVLHNGPIALAQMTCAVAHPGTKGLQDNNQNSVTRRPPGGNILSGLIEQRLSLMTDVARAKWNGGSAIEDPTREQQLLADVAVKAQTAGISAAWAQHFFRIQIEAAKEVQYCLFAQWTAERQGPFPQVQDLKTGIRPKLDLLTAELLQELARQWPQLSKRGSPEENESLYQQSGNWTASRVAWLPLIDGSLQSYGHVHPIKSR
jgi:chorismate mutase